MSAGEPTFRALVANLERFAIMRATRPILLDIHSRDAFIEHVYDLRDWARKHTAGACVCADNGWCPFCSLQTCSICERTLGANQLCDRCIREADYDDRYLEETPDRYEGGLL